MAAHGLFDQVAALIDRIATECSLNPIKNNGTVADLACSTRQTRGKLARMRTMLHRTSERQWSQRQVFVADCRLQSGSKSVARR